MSLKSVLSTILKKSEQEVGPLAAAITGPSPGALLIAIETGIHVLEIWHPKVIAGTTEPAAAVVGSQVALSDHQSLALAISEEVLGPHLTTEIEAEIAALVKTILEAKAKIPIELGGLKTS